MRKISLIGFVMLIVSIPTFAGGLLTNTINTLLFFVCYLVVLPLK